MLDQPAVLIILQIGDDNLIEDALRMLAPDDNKTVEELEGLCPLKRFTSRVDHVARSAIDYPGGKAATSTSSSSRLAGHTCRALNGGPNDRFNHAISLSQRCTIRPRSTADRERGQARAVRAAQEYVRRVLTAVPEALARIKGQRPAREESG